ncbi:MAG: hypothetical protein WKG01_01900 [Kofleriaceae bacterium]
MPEPIEIRPQLAVLHVCTPRHLRDALDHVEVTRCGRDDLAERLTKLRAAEVIRQRRSCYHCETGRDQPRRRRGWL